MKTLFRIAYRNLIQHYKWSIPTALSILIAVTLMSSLSTLIGTYVMTSRNTIINTDGPYHLVTYHTSKAQQEALSQNELVKSIAIYDVVNYAKIKDYELLNEQTPYLKLVNFDPIRMSSKGINLVQGRLPKADHEIALNETALYYTNLNLQIGDEIVLSLGQRFVNDEHINDRYLQDDEQFMAYRNEPFTIVGIINALPFLSDYDEAGAFSLVNKTSPRAENNITLIELNNPGATSLYQMSSYLNEEGLEFNKTVLMTTFFADINFFSESPTNFAILITSVISILILVSALVVIYNAFSINDRYMIRQLGTLDAIGATQKQKRWVMLMQAILISLVSIPVGLLLGYIATSLLLVVFQRPLSELVAFEQISISVFPSALLFIFALSFFVVVFASIISARKISKLSSIESMKYFERQIEQKMDLKIPSFFKKIEFKLAYINFRKNFPFFRSIIVSMIISIILIGTSFSLSRSQKRMNYKQNRDVVYYYNQENVQDGQLIKLVDELKQNPAIHQSGLWTEYTVMLKYDMKINQDYQTAMGDEFIYLIVNVVDDEFCQEVLQAQFPDYDYLNQGLFLDYFEIDYLAENNETKQVKGRLFEENQNLNLELDGKPIQFDLASNDIYYSKSNVEKDLVLYFSQSYFNQLTTPFAMVLKAGATPLVNEIHQVFVNSQNSLDAEKILVNQLSKNGLGNLDWVDNLKQLNLIENQLFQFYSIISLSLIYLVITITLSNIFNSINHTLALRERELAVLISNGMTYSSYLKMILAEVSLMGFVSFMIGLPISFIVSMLINYFLNLEIYNYLSHWLLISFICIVLVAILILVAVFLSLLNFKNHQFTNLSKE